LVSSSCLKYLIISLCPARKLNPPFEDIGSSQPDLPLRRIRGGHIS
jgi:hypothetical protein